MPIYKIAYTVTSGEQEYWEDIYVDADSPEEAVTVAKCEIGPYEYRDQNGENWTGNTYEFFDTTFKIEGMKTVSKVSILVFSRKHGMYSMSFPIEVGTIEEE